LEVGVEQHPGDLGKEQDLVVGRMGDRLLVVTQPAPGLRVGVRHHGVEQLDEGVDGPHETIDPEHRLAYYAHSHKPARQSARSGFPKRTRGPARSSP